MMLASNLFICLHTCQTSIPIAGYFGQLLNERSTHTKKIQNKHLARYSNGVNRFLPILFTRFIGLESLFQHLVHWLMSKLSPSWQRPKHILTDLTERSQVLSKTYHIFLREQG
jgi:hypothetical protein